MTSHDTAILPRTVGLRTILSVLILVALLPPLFFLAIAIWRAGAADRASSNEQFLGQARAMSSIFASALEANLAVVDTIAHLPATADGSIDRLSDVSSIFSAQVSTPDANPAYPAGPAEHGKWTASNLFDIEPGVRARLAITINTGITSDAPGMVTLVMDPRQLTQALRFDTRVYGSALVAVVDGNGRIIARSRDEDRFVGAPVPTWEALLAVGSPSGIFSAKLLDGDSITFAFSSIPGTPGWVVVAGVPTALVDARWREPLVFLLGGSIAAVLAGLGLTFLLARRIARPLSSLAAYADASTTGLPAEPPGASRVSEFETLRRSLLDAQSKLLDRANRLALSEARYRAVARVGAVVTWRRSADGPLLELEGWQDLTGLASEGMLGDGWVRAIHRDDLPLVEENWRTAVADQGPLDFECRIALRNDSWLYVRIRGACLRDATGAPSEWAGTIEDIDTRKQRELRDSHLAFHDELTGLPNRGLLRDRLDRAISATGTDTVSALLYIDLDHFKQANDTYGHAAGDAVLRLVADRLAGQLRPSDTPARLGGDEFAAVLHDIEHLDAAVVIALRLIRTLSVPFDIGGVSISIGASVGLTLIDNDDPANEVLRRADMALYEAKGGGRNRCIVFDERRHQRLSA